MGIEVKREGNTAWVVLAGELTIYTVAKIKAGLAEAMSGVTEIAVDLSGINDADSAGLQLMLIAKRNPGKHVRFFNHPPPLLRLIDLANVGGLLGDPLLMSAAKP